jgi:hypothetical protein
MTRAAMWAALIVCIATQPAAAGPFHREDLRIAMEAAGPRGLEAMLLRPSGTRRYPLALISHGAPRRGRAPSPISPPPQLRDKGRAGFADYLSASPHRAFAVSPKGAFTFRGGRRPSREAAEAILAACAEYASDCTLYAVDDHCAESANAGSR